MARHHPDGAPWRQERQDRRVAPLPARVGAPQPALRPARGGDPLGGRHRRLTSGCTLRARPGRRAAPADEGRGSPVLRHGSAVRPVPRPSAHRRLPAEGLLRNLRLPAPLAALHGEGQEDLRRGEGDRGGDLQVGLRAQEDAPGSAAASGRRAARRADLREGQGVHRGAGEGRAAGAEVQPPTAPRGGRGGRPAPTRRSGATSRTVCGR